MRPLDLLVAALLPTVLGCEAAAPLAFLRAPDAALAELAAPIEIPEGTPKAMVLGAVARPGFVAVGPTTTLLDAVRQAGGLTPTAARSVTITTTPPGGARKIVSASLVAMAEGKVTPMRLAEGDVVVVPERD